MVERPELIGSLLRSLPPTLQTLEFEMHCGLAGSLLPRQLVVGNVPAHMHLLEWHAPHNSCRYVSVAGHLDCFCHRRVGQLGRSVSFMESGCADCFGIYIIAAAPCAAVYCSGWVAQSAMTEHDKLGIDKQDENELWMKFIH